MPANALQNSRRCRYRQHRADGMTTGVSRSYRLSIRLIAPAIKESCFGETQNWTLASSLRAQASLYLSPRSGPHIHSEAVEPRSGGTPRKRKEQSEPRRQEWAAACHGVGRKPGDGKVRP